MSPKSQRPSRALQMFLGEEDGDMAICLVCSVQHRFYPNICKLPLQIAFSGLSEQMLSLDTLKDLKKNTMKNQVHHRNDNIVYIACAVVVTPPHHTHTPGAAVRYPTLKSDFSRLFLFLLQRLRITPQERDGRGGPTSVQAQLLRAPYQRQLHSSFQTMSSLPPTEMQFDLLSQLAFQLEKEDLEPS